MRPSASPGATSVSVASEATAANAQAPPMSAAPATRVPRSGDEAWHAGGDGRSAAQPDLGEQQQDDEEHQRRDRQSHVREDAVARQVAHRVRLRQAEHQRTDEGERHAPEPPDHRRRVRVHDEERESLDVELEHRGQEDPGDRGERRSEGPAEHRRASRSGADQRRQPPVVDHGTHRHARSGLEHDQPEPERDGGGDDHRRELVPGHEDRTEVEATRPEEPVDATPLGRPQVDGEPHQDQEQADGDHEARDERRLARGCARGSGRRARRRAARPRGSRTRG